MFLFGVIFQCARTHLTKCISADDPILLKMGDAVTWKIMIRSGHEFAHVMTAELSWCIKVWHHWNRYNENSSSNIFSQDLIYGPINCFEICSRSSEHRNKNVVILTKFASLAALEVVNLTTSSATIDENFIRYFRFRVTIIPYLEHKHHWNRSFIMMEFFRHWRWCEVLLCVTALIPWTRLEATILIIQFW